jgi:hypothetical protein
MPGGQGMADEWQTRMDFWLLRINIDAGEKGFHRREEARGSFSREFSSLILNWYSLS